MLTSPKYRPDIDGLRAFAVLAVVGFHAFPDLVRGGFVGVDVFFVVSGFLISSLILGSLEKGGFSFAQFYGRRVKRIFPALIVVLAAGYAFGWFVLLPDEYKDMGKDIAAGAGFIANIVLWNEAGYFDESMTIKPLLHLWSLGIEEQFYIVWPPLLYLTWKRRPALLFLTLLIAAASFAVNLATVQGNAIAAFYSPLSRFFELLAGSALAVPASVRQAGSRSREAAAALGLLLIVAALLLIDKDKLFPGWWAMLPTVGTCLIVFAGRDAWLNRKVLAQRALVWIGLISYPLYLWHWPLLSYARIIERGEPAPALRIALVLASVPLAWMTYALIERPVRFGNHARAKVAVLCALMVVTGLAGYGTYLAGGLPSRAVGESAKQIIGQGAWPYLLNPDCARKYVVIPCQSNSEHPKFMILGDSHANHLYPGLALAEPVFDVIQAGFCPPLESVTLHVEKNQDRHPCAKSDFLGLNYRILERHPTIRTVILASWWTALLTGDLRNVQETAFWGKLTLVSAYPEEAGKSKQELVLLGLSRTIKTLRARGLKVVLIRDTPDLSPDLAAYCKFNPRFMPRNCTMTRREYVEYRRLEDGLLRALRENFPDLAVYDPIESLCDQARCYLMRDGELLYRDRSHLSVNGSKHLANDLKKWMAGNNLLD